MPVSGALHVLRVGGFYMAKKFNFKLQAVLRYRQSIEDDKRSRFVAIQGTRDLQQKKIDSLKEESTKALEAMVDAKTGAVDVARVKLLNRYITGLNVSSRQAEGEMRVIEKEVDKRREELVVARQGVRVLEKVRERKVAEHQYEENREETRNFDEIASQKHFSGSSNRDSGQRQARDEALDKDAEPTG